MFICDSCQEKKYNKEIHGSHWPKGKPELKKHTCKKCIKDWLGYKK